MTGFSGTFAPGVATAITDLDGSTVGPPIQQGAAPVVATGPAEFTVPYYLQSGPIKYAPMQPIPPTKITAQSATPLNPTSAFTIATTFLPIPSIQLTTTLAQTFSVSSVENTVCLQAVELFV